MAKAMVWAERQSIVLLCIRARWDSERGDCSWSSQSSTWRERNRERDNYYCWAWKSSSNYEVYQSFNPSNPQVSSIVRINRMTIVKMIAGNRILCARKHPRRLMSGLRQQVEQQSFVISLYPFLQRESQFLPLLTSSNSLRESKDMDPFATSAKQIRCCGKLIL